MSVLWLVNILSWLTLSGVGNLLHCSPRRTQDDIFSHLGHSNACESGETQISGLLRNGGWVAVYGAFMTDDGSFASDGDEKVSYLLHHPVQLANPCSVPSTFHGYSP